MEEAPLSLPFIFNLLRLLFRLSTRKNALEKLYNFHNGNDAEADTKRDTVFFPADDGKAECVCKESHFANKGRQKQRTRCRKPQYYVLFLDGK